MLRLVQLLHKSEGRRVGVVEEPRLRLLAKWRSVYELAMEAIGRACSVAEVIGDASLGEPMAYDAVYGGQSEWKLLPPIDYPNEPARCLVTGTGLTHKASAENRDSMHVPGRVGAAHQAQPDTPLTDSLKMYRIGLEGGRPDAGKIGAAPEWFYKGCGAILKTHNELLTVPNFAEDGGDEAEIAGAYVIGPDGAPYRIGLVQGNEFSDHVTESKNYLYLAPSKLRQCAIGPELVVGGDFTDVPGKITIERGSEIIWQAKIASGEANMCHSLANLEHHHFKYDQHRRPGDIHVHFFGADHFSFRDRVRLQYGDVMAVSFDGFGRPLRNPLKIENSPQALVTARPL
ncbi:MAG TPA: AraD1 family protein [Pirellulaceae bacterium]|jgi:hypothetical protein